MTAPPLIVGDRIRLRAGERIRARVLVSVASVAISSLGGLDYLRNAIADVGFRDVRVYADAPPPEWGERARPTPASFPAWLLWVEATPTSDAELSTRIVEGAEVTDAWRVGEVSSSPSVPSSSPSPPAAAGAGSSPAAIAGVTIAGVAILALLCWSAVESETRATTSSSSSLSSRARRR